MVKCVKNTLSIYTPARTIQFAESDDDSLEASKETLMRLVVLGFGDRLARRGELIEEVCG